MITTAKSLILMIAVTACGKRGTDYKRADPMVGDPHLIAEYYDLMAQFIDGVGNSGDDLKVVKVVYDPLNDSVLGRCNYDVDGRYIQIREDLREAPKAREMILMHEIGHCSYNLNHYEGKPDIMNAVMDYLGEFEASPDAYKEQMYTRMKGGEGVLNFVDLPSIQ